MSNQNNDSNPPKPSPQNIQVTPHTQGPMQTANTAGMVYGGVGNTYNEIHAQGDKERVRKELRDLRGQLSVKEGQKQERQDEVQKMELKIEKLKEEVATFRQQTYGIQTSYQNLNVSINSEAKKNKREDIQNIKKKIRKLMQDIELKKDEIAKLEKNVIPRLKEQMEEAEVRLKVLKETVEDTKNAIPDLEKQVLDLQHNLIKYSTDVKAEKENIAELHRLVHRLRKDLTDRKNDQKALTEKMQGIEVEQEKQKRRCEDLRRENIVVRRKNKDLQSQIQKLNQVIEEKDKDIGRLEDARATTERKVEEPQDAGQEKTTQNKNGREPEMKVTQKDSNPRHVDALLAACRDGNMAEVKRVLDLGQIDVNSRGERSWTPVMAAAEEGHRDVVELLVSRGADVSLVFGDGKNTLHLACCGGDVGMVELILSQDVVDVNCRGLWSRTPVMEAAWWGHRGVVELLLRRGADVSLVDEDGYSTLHLACGGGDVGMVELILSLDVVEVNSRGEGNRTPVMWAAVRRHRDVVEFLLRRGADVSLVDGGGNNTLHLACDSGDVGTVELILSLDMVDVNARNNRGRTAADVARVKGHHQLVDLLVSRGDR